jgi:hypothetical protein
MDIIPVQRLKPSYRNFAAVIEFSQDGKTRVNLPSFCPRQRPLKSFRNGLVQNCNFGCVAIPDRKKKIKSIYYKLFFDLRARAAGVVAMPQLRISIKSIRDMINFAQIKAGRGRPTLGERGGRDL